jgi:hypothetical protein
MRAWPRQPAIDLPPTFSSGPRGHTISPLPHDYGDALWRRSPANTRNSRTGVSIASSRTRMWVSWMNCCCWADFVLSTTRVVSQGRILTGLMRGCLQHLASYPLVHPHPGVVIGCGPLNIPAQYPSFAIGRAISHPSVSPSGASRGLRRIYQVFVKLNSIRSGSGQLLPSSQSEIGFSARICSAECLRTCQAATSQPPCHVT